MPFKQDTNRSFQIWDWIFYEITQLFIICYSFVVFLLQLEE